MLIYIHLTYTNDISLVSLQKFLTLTLKEEEEE